jgi:hypothetical protein
MKKCAAAFLFGTSTRPVHVSTDEAFPAVRLQVHEALAGHLQLGLTVDAWLRPGKSFDAKPRLQSNRNLCSESDFAFRSDEAPDMRSLSTLLFASNPASLVAEMVPFDAAFGALRLGPYEEFVR